jgi:hypothetical protein
VLEALEYDTDNWYGSSHIHRWFDFPNGRRDRYVIEHSTIAGLPSAEWDERSVRISCDQRLISTRNKADDPGERYWPFTSDMALILELGHKPNPYTDWGSEYGTDDSKLPARMFVDYVRAFRKKT